MLGVWLEFPVVLTCPITKTPMVAAKRDQLSVGPFNGWIPVLTRPKTWTLIVSILTKKAPNCAKQKVEEVPICFGHRRGQPGSHFSQQGDEGERLGPYFREPGRKSTFSQRPSCRKDPSSLLCSSAQLCHPLCPLAA